MRFFSLRSHVLAISLLVTGLGAGCTSDAAATAGDEASSDAIVGVNESALRAGKSLKTLVEAADEVTDSDRKTLTRLSAEAATIEGQLGPYQVYFVWPDNVEPYEDAPIEGLAVLSKDALFFYDADGGVAWSSAIDAAALDAEAADFSMGLVDAQPSDSVLTPQGGLLGKMVTSAAKAMIEGAARAMKTVTHAEAPTVWREATEWGERVVAETTSKIADAPAQLREFRSGGASEVRAVGTNLGRRTQAELAAIAAFNQTQQSRARAQAIEAVKIGREHLVPVADAERYGTDPEQYQVFVEAALQKDPQRYTRAVQNLDKELFGLPVSTNAHGQRVVYVYHGGSIPEAAAFDLSKVSNIGVLGQGVYFSTEESLAADYAKKSGGRVIRLEIPVADLQGQQRLKLVAPSLGGIKGIQFDGPFILNVAGFGTANPGVYGAFTDAKYVNSLVRKTTQTFEGAGDGFQ
jgi:hypothetical protein